MLFLSLTDTLVNCKSLSACTHISRSYEEAGVRVPNRLLRCEPYIKSILSGNAGFSSSEQHLSELLFARVKREFWERFVEKYLKFRENESRGCVYSCCYLSCVFMSTNCACMHVWHGTYTGRHDHFSRIKER